MFINALKIEKDSMLQSTVCIVGAGVAGISIALELKKAGIDVCLLESGGLASDKFTVDLCRGENAGLPYTFADGSRSRYLGGSSNCWGGWCAPMTDCDFAKRDWVSYSGWPIGLQELEPFYRQSHAVLKLGPYNYDPAYWEKIINRRNVRRAPFMSGKITDGISQFSPPARLGILYRDELKDAASITAILYANVTDIETNESGTAVTSVKVATLSGNYFRVSAKFFVLATGGIENARLLLCSNSVQKNGLGNQNDLVGRFFMDHPRMLTGSVRLSKPWLRNMLYDIRYQYHNPYVSAHHVCVASQFVLKPEVMRQEEILHARVSLYSLFYSEKSRGVSAANRLKDAFFKNRFEGFDFRKDMASVLSHPFDIGMYGLASKYKLRSLVQEVKFQIIMEQSPDPSSRVMLTNEKDKLGMNRVKVNWQLGEIEQRTYNQTLQIVASELKGSGMAENILLDPPVKNNQWPGELTGTWHHMGTTRMHDSPMQGVVDRNCRVHGIHNLYIAGSSVFPTGGSNFPTITLTALALRLAGELAMESEKSKSAQHVSVPKQVLLTE